MLSGVKMGAQPWADFLLPPTLSLSFNNMAPPMLALWGCSNYNAMKRPLPQSRGLILSPRTGHPLRLILAEIAQGAIMKNGHLKRSK